MKIQVVTKRDPYTWHKEKNSNRTGHSNKPATFRISTLWCKSCCRFLWDVPDITAKARSSWTAVSLWQAYCCQLVRMSWAAQKGTMAVRLHPDTFTLKLVWLAVFKQTVLVWFVVLHKSSWLTFTSCGSRGRDKSCRTFLTCVPTAKIKTNQSVSGLLMVIKTPKGHSFTVSLLVLVIDEFYATAHSSDHSLRWDLIHAKGQQRRHPGQFLRQKTSVIGGTCARVWWYCLTADFDWFLCLWGRDESN